MTYVNLNSSDITFFYTELQQITDILSVKGATMLTFPNTDWSKELKSILASKSVQKLFKQIDDEYDEYTILPKKENVFKAFELTSYKNTKVVILGQDPYPDALNAMGLSFSVYPNVPLPRSLVNIYKERLSDVNIPMSTHGDLSNWAKQGVLLLNTTLTLREHKSNSHVKYGWNKLFTDKVIELLNNGFPPSLTLCQILHRLSFSSFSFIFINSIIFNKYYSLKLGKISINFSILFIFLILSIYKIIYAPL